MTFSRSILATDKNKNKLSWWEYWIGHCYMTGWQSIHSNFRTWMDLVWFEENQKDYALLKEDDPFEQCYLCFWYDLNDDNTYPKEFLESLMQMADDVQTGKVEMVPYTKEMFDRLFDLVGDLIDE
jgi:hypothetical protein